VDVGGILKTLMEKSLIKIMGRKNLPGRPLIYGTTRRFLEVFELKNLDSLPKLKEIKEFGIDEEGTEMPQKEVLQDQTTGEEQSPERPDPSPQESVEPAADPIRNEGTED
jgi:segregation and condensation protein B